MNISDIVDASIVAPSLSASPPKASKSLTSTSKPAATATTSSTNNNNNTNNTMMRTNNTNNNMSTSTTNITNSKAAVLGSIKTAKNNTANTANRSQSNANTKEKKKGPSSATINAVDEASLLRKAAAYEEEQRSKVVQWFKCVGASPTTDEEYAAILEERQLMAEEMARRARGADRSRLAVETRPLPPQLNPNTNGATSASVPSTVGGGGNVSPRSGVGANAPKAKNHYVDGNATASGAFVIPSPTSAASAPIGATRSVPIELIESVMNGTFPHDDPAVIAAINTKVEAHNKRHGGGGGGGGGGASSSFDQQQQQQSSLSGNGATTAATLAKEGVSPAVPPPPLSRRDLLLGNTGHLTAIDALTRAAHQATLVSTANANAQQAAAAAGGTAGGGGGRSGGTPTKRGSTPPGSRQGGKGGANGPAGSLEESLAALNASMLNAEDPFIAEKRRKAASDLETDKLLQLALGGDLFTNNSTVLASGGGAAANGTGGTESPSLTAQKAPSSAAGGRTSASAGGGGGSKQRTSQAEASTALLNSIANNIVINADGSVTSPQQLQMLQKEQAAGAEEAAKVQGLIGHLVAGGKVADGQAGAGLEARQALREQFALMARVVLLRQRFDRRANLALKAIQQRSMISGGGGDAAATAALFNAASNKVRGVEFARNVTLVEMPSLLPPTGDNPLTAAVPISSAAAAPSGGNKSAAGGAAAANGGRQGTSQGGARGGLDLNATVGSPNPKNKAAVKAAQQAQALALQAQQAQQQEQQQKERQAVLLKLAPATVVVSPTDPNHLSLLGERISSAVDMAVMAPKKAYAPYEFKLKGYKPFPFPASEGLNADPLEAVPVLPAGPEAVPEAPAIVPALEHFAQPIPTLETFPLPRHSFSQFAGVSVAETLLNFDVALHTNISSQYAHCHDRGHSSTVVASTLALHTLVPTPFMPSSNGGLGVGGALGAGVALDPNVLATVVGQQQEAAALVVGGRGVFGSGSPSSPSSTTTRVSATCAATASAYTMPSAGFLNGPQLQHHHQKQKKGGGGKRGNSNKHHPNASSSSSTGVVVLMGGGAEKAADTTVANDGMARLRTAVQLLDSVANTATALLPSASSTGAGAANKTTLGATANTALSATMTATTVAKPSATMSLKAMASKAAASNGNSSSSAANPTQLPKGAFAPNRYATSGGASLGLLRAVGAVGGSGAPLRMRYADPRDDLSDDSDDDEGYPNLIAAGGGGGGANGAGAGNTYDSDKEDGESMQPTAANNILGPLAPKPLHFLSLPPALAALTPRDGPEGGGAGGPHADANGMMSPAAGGNGGSNQTKRTASPNSSSAGANLNASVVMGGVAAGGGVSGAAANPAALGVSAVFTPQQQQIVAAAVLNSNNGVPLRPAQQAEIVGDAMLEEDRAAWALSAAAASSSFSSGAAVAADHRRWDGAQMRHNGPMLDSRLSFLMSSQLRSALPAEPYGVRSWIPLPNVNGTAASVIGSNGGGANSNTSSVGNTLQRLGAAGPTSRPPAFFP